MIKKSKYGRPQKNIPKRSREAVEKAIGFFKTQAAFARALGVKSPSVRDWKRNGVPAERVQSIVRAVKGFITESDLRPDLYPTNEKRRIY